MKILTPMGVLAALLALPAAAQSTQDLNARVATQANAAATTNAVNAEVAAANQAQYETDRQSYMAALVQHDRAVDRTAARTVRQQTAYADAMAVWRVQVDQCKKGRQKACDMPAPNPADYY